MRFLSALRRACSDFCSTTIAMPTTTCQCPVAGFSHFYIFRLASVSDDVRCVNALHRASPISTKDEVYTQYVFMCVNALHRASPISTRGRVFWAGETVYVAMPYIGLLPFLRRHLKLVTVVNRSVSMPYIGLLPFLHDEPEDEPTATACVNALHRASPIST